MCGDNDDFYIPSKNRVLYTGLTTRQGLLGGKSTLKTPIRLWSATTTRTLDWSVLEKKRDSSGSFDTIIVSLHEKRKRLCELSGESLLVCWHCCLLSQNSKLIRSSLSILTIGFWCAGSNNREIRVYSVYVTWY